MVVTLGSSSTGSFVERHHARETQGLAWASVLSLKTQFRERAEACRRRCRDVQACGLMRRTRPVSSRIQTDPNPTASRTGYPLTGNRATIRFVRGLMR